MPQPLLTFESDVEHGYGPLWLPVNVTGMAYNTQLMWRLDQHSLPIQIYNHTTDGVKQESLFFGSHNVTICAIKSVTGDGGSGEKPGWMMHLLGPSNADPETGKPLYDDEYRTRIRIGGN